MRVHIGLLLSLFLHYYHSVFLWKSQVFWQNFNHWGRSFLAENLPKGTLLWIYFQGKLSISNKSKPCKECPKWLKIDQKGPSPMVEIRVKRFVLAYCLPIYEVSHFFLVLTLCLRFLFLMLHFVPILALAYQ